MKKDSPLLLAIEWVDLPFFIFYHFGFLVFLNFGLGWKVFLAVWLCFWLVRFLWSNYLLKTEYLNLPVLFFLRNTLNASNIFIIIAVILAVYLKLYIMAGFIVLWKITVRAFQFCSPVKKPDLDSYIKKISESINE